MKLVLLIIFSMPSLYALSPGEVNNKDWNHLLVPYREVKTEDLTFILLNQIDILKLTHKEAIVHP